MENKEHVCAGLRSRDEYCVSDYKDTGNYCINEATLTSERVEAIFMDCLSSGEVTDEYMVVHGITTNVGFHTGRLESHRVEIEAMLAELPDEFHASGGGGYSFLHACNDKHGNQWTSSQQQMEQLFQLGEGIGKVKCLLPRSMWPVLPGGVPYFVIS